MRSLSASSKGKAAGEGEGARTVGALPFPSRGRLARVATLAMAGGLSFAGFGGPLGEKRVETRKFGPTVKNCLSWSSRIEFKLGRPKSAQIARGKRQAGEIYVES